MISRSWEKIAFAAGLGLLLLATACSLSVVTEDSQGAEPDQPESAVGETMDDWEVLFDGGSTDAWRAYQRDEFPEGGWVRDGAALKTVPGGDVVDIVTRKQYTNFEFSLEWKVSPAGNSGIFFNVTEDFPRAWQTGPELQVLDDEGHGDGSNPLTSAGSLYALIAPENKKLKPVGEFNEARLVVRGTQVQHWLNGAKVIEFDLDSPELAEKIAQSKFAELPRFAKNRSGHLALQHHGEEVWYRNLRVRELAE